MVVRLRSGHLSRVNPTIFNSVYFIEPNITHYKFSSEGFTICTHTTSLTFDLTSDQEKLPRNREKKFTGLEKGKTPSGEQQRRIPLFRVDRSNRCHVTRMKHYRDT